MNNLIKTIGTVSFEEVDGFSVNWDSVVKVSLPFNNLSNPKDFLWTAGSACTSLATTSVEGYKYILDFNVFRSHDYMNKPGLISVDRYLGSITQDSVEILKLHPSLFSYHHLTREDGIFKNLPNQFQERLILRGIPTFRS